VNKLPNVDTDVPSNLSVRSSVLKPDSPKADQFEGESTIYVDDFEGSQTTIDMRSSYSWSLSSTRIEIREDTISMLMQMIYYGFKRSRLAWYSIDPIFYTQNLSEFQMTTCHNTTRRIYSEELYPLTDIAQGQSQVINTLDLSYYPSERGAYNNDVNFAADPAANFGGIMRSLNSTNFEQGMWITFNFG
jgi:cell surface protein SprA